MIILDTHIWIWLINQDSKLPINIKSIINQNEILGLSQISCWEVSMLVSKNRLDLQIDINIWMKYATKYSKIKLLELSPEISILSNNLSTTFHQDPADRIITATAIKMNLPLATLDKNIINSNLVETIS